MTQFALWPLSRARRFVPRALFLAILAAFTALPAHAALFSQATPAARIIYTADTLGHTDPCKTCGSEAIGGMARRAALITRLVEGQSRPFILAGPYEFYDDRRDAKEATAKELAPLFRAAFSHMPYSAVYVSEKAATRMKGLAIALPPKGVAASSVPVTNFYRAGKFTVACVFFPSPDTPSGPSPGLLLAVQHAAKEAAGKAALVIGVSPWGMEAENTCAASLAGYFHILFGSGKGLAIPGQATGSPTAPGPLWVRADRQGRCVSVLDIFSLPEKANSPWLDGVHFSARLIPLERSLPEDPAMLTILKTAPQNQ